jgi:regulator of RNase E activity RraA
MSTAVPPTAPDAGAVAPTSAIADVLALWGFDGWLTPPLDLVVAGAESPVVGRALTVQISAAATGPGFSQIYDVLSQELSGGIVVMAGAQPVGGAVFGELLASAAAGRGAVSVLVDGWIRDCDELALIGLPVIAAGTRVVGPYGTAHITAVDTVVDIGGVAISPNDVVVTDRSGAVRIPAPEAEAVLAAARRYAAAEVAVAEALADGEPLTAAYRHKRAMLDELRR